MTTSALDDRYGRARNRARTRLGWTALGVCAVAAVGALGWMTVHNEMNAVSSDDLAFHVADAHSVTVSFQFASRPGEDVTCALEALDSEFGVVGFRVIRYPATDSHQRQFVETIRTVGEATTGLVQGCWVS